MRTIKGKVLTIYFLILAALVSTISASYISSDTQSQHIILTELLSMQKLAMEKITLITTDISEEVIYNNIDNYKKKNAKYKDEVIKYKDNINKILKNLKKKEYILEDGKKIKLKFRGQFLKEFDEALDDAILKWIDLQMDIDYLLNPNNLDDILLYEYKFNGFENKNKELITSSQTLIMVCKEIAQKQKQNAFLIQIITLFFTVIVFGFIINILNNDFKKPVNKLKDALYHMSKGEFIEGLFRKENDEFKSIFSNFNRFVNSLKSIRKIESKIIEEESIEEVLNEINLSFKEFINFDQINIVYRNSLEEIIQMEYKDNKIKSKPIKMIHEYDKITMVDEHTIAIPIALNDGYIGYASFYSKEKFQKNSSSFFKIIKNALNIAFYKSILTKDLLSIITESLADLTESRDPETRKHLVRMSSYSQIISKKLREKGKFTDKINSNFIENIKLTAPMHDIGKVAIKDDILLKKGKLTDEEYEIMKTHAQAGADVLNRIHKRFMLYNINYFDMAVNIANYHQEKYNGNGYPNAIKEDEIPLEARICAVADVFDALTSKRPYKEAFSLEHSYNILKNSKGSHFDPDVLDAFFDSLDEIEEIYEEYKEV
ncbi:HD domain-containing phosphohydrolase [Peptostreptococcaceae bacterium AGR-M142]